MKPLHIFGREIIDDAAVKQLQNCMTEDSIGVLTADAHKGYVHPIGGAIAYKDFISPSGVGYDIGCGNMAVCLDMQYNDIAGDIPKIMDDIYSSISFGMGRPNNEPVDHPLLDMIADSDLPHIANLAQLAANQLGTVGGGNHFVDLFRDESDHIWIGVHFGSRGFGHKIASGFIALAKGLPFTERVNESMDASPVLLKEGTELFQDYTYAMNLAGAYASAGREAVVMKVMEIIMGGKMFDDDNYMVHNHHNFAWYEEHFGENYWVVRKGCTPAFPSQQGFIGSNMMDVSYIVEGIESEESAKGLYSTVHGAGRVLSRIQAAGKKKWICGEDGRKRPQVVAPGAIDFEMVKKAMKENHVELRGAGADEAPLCYKPLEEVLGYQGDTIRMLHILTPIGVAMAGADEQDPYKD